MYPTHNCFERMVVLLDPSSEDGEAGAGLARSLLGGEGHVVLAVAMSGPEAWALEAYAEAEGVSVRDAASIYLAQVEERLGHGRVTVTVVDGADLAADLSWVAMEANADAVVVPAGMAARTIATKRAWAELPFPLLVTPRRLVAA